MEQSRIFSFIHSALVCSTQMAYIEEAQETLSLLEQTNTVFRYFTGQKKESTLFEELDTLGKYLSILRVRFGERIHTNCTNEARFNNIFIGRSSVIGLVDSLVEEILELDISLAEINLEFLTDSDACLMKAFVKMDGVEKCILRELNEKNGQWDGSGTNKNTHSR